MDDLSDTEIEVLIRHLLFEHLDERTADFAVEWLMLRVEAYNEKEGRNGDD